MTKPKVKTRTLSERAMLVNLQISQWSARKLNRAETNAVNRSHNLTVEAARVNVNLLPLGMELQQVHKTTRAIREEYDQHTSPWGLQGVNILKSSAYMDFVQLANRWRADYDDAVNRFVEAYPGLRKEAETLLNGLFREEDYPSVEDMQRRFRFSIRFMPIPDKGDWRVDVGDEAAKRLREDISQQLAEAETLAMQSVWKRLYDVVSKAKERLSQPDAEFRSSLVDNAVELCALLPSLNITDDPKLEKLRQDLEGSLCRQTPDILRADPLVRKETSDKMADIMSKMGHMFN